MRQSFFYLWIASLMCVAGSAFGQNFIPDLPDDNKLVIVHHDTAYVVHVTDKVVSKPERERMYWFVHHRELGFARGGYLGKLVHGKYVVYTNKTHLLEQGNFNNGLKNDCWIKWYSNGELESVENWKNGKGDGKRIEYAIDGHVHREYKWHNGAWQLLKKYARKEKSERKRKERLKVKTETMNAKVKERQEEKAKRDAEKVNKKGSKLRGLIPIFTKRRKGEQEQPVQIKGDAKLDPQEEKTIKRRIKNNKDRSTTNAAQPKRSKVDGAVEKSQSSASKNNGGEKEKKSLLWRLGLKK